jgi:hypothetical protein
MSYSAADFMGEVCTVAAEIGAPIPDDADWGSDETAAAAAAVCAALRAAGLVPELLAALRTCAAFIENVSDDTPERTARFFACRESWRAAIAKADALTEGDFWTEYTSA